MSVAYITIDSMENNFLYTCKKYIYLYGNCGYYYVMLVVKEAETAGRLMRVTDGHLFDHLENMRKNNITSQFSFKKLNMTIAPGISVDPIIIIGVNEFVDLIEV